jgi:aryl carrier-like protein
MATAQDLINKSSKMAGTLAQGQTLEAGLNADALDILNLMLARWRNEGVDLGISTLTATDTLFIDDADEEAIKLSLAIRLMVENKRPIGAGLAGAARSAFTELQAKYAIIKEMTLDRALTRKVLPRKNEFDTGDF